MRRFPEKNKFPGWFHTSLWKSKTSLKCSWSQIISCHPCPRHLADRSSLPHMDRSCFPSPGVVVLSVPKAQSKALLSKAPELLLPQPCWGAEGHNMRPSFRSDCYPEIRKCSLVFAGIWQQFLGWNIFTLQSCLYPSQQVQISSAFLLRAWQVRSSKFLLITEFINFTSKQVYHRELNLMPAWAKM